MSAEAILKQGSPELTKLTAAAAVASGEVWQMPNGRAAVYKGQNAAEANDLTSWCDEGKATVVKTTSQVWIKGAPIWWDHSANAATCNEPLGSSDRDFYLGCAVEDVASATATGEVDLNKLPSYIIDSTRDNGDTAIIKTVVGSTTVEVPNVIQQGGMLRFNFGTTAEAQKVDWISERGFAIGSNWVAEILFELVTAADNAAVDINFGVASGGHDTDFDAVAEFAVFHLDGDDLNVDVQSDDGITDVAITDSTTDIVAGTPMRFTLDGRNIDNVKFYINGAETNAATTDLGDIGAGAGPLFAIIHAEKTSDDSPLVFKARIRVRTMQQD